MSHAPIASAPLRVTSNRHLHSLTDEKARIWVVLCYTAVAVGSVLRALRYFDAPAVWLDEALLAINILEKPLADIFGPLLYLQSAPPGFLLVEEGAESLLGDAEWSLRLVPFLASLAALLLFAHVCRQTLAPAAAAFGILLFATAEPLLLRTAEIKHYSVDVMVTTLLLALYCWIRAASPERSTRRIVVLAVVAPACLWFSFPAVFTLAAVVAALALLGWQRQSRAPVVGATVLAPLALAMFGVVYAVAAGNAGRVSASIFGSGDPELAAGRLKTVENAWWTLINPGGFENETAALAALLSGFAVIALARTPTLDRLALLTVPLVLAAAADAVHRYPLGGRFSLFLVPLLILLAARGAQALVGWSRRPLVVGAGVAVFLAASPAALAAYHVLQPPARSDVKPLLRQLADGWRSGDSLYVYPDSQYQLRYYSQCEDCSISAADFPWPTRLAPPSSPREQYAPALRSIPPSVIVGSTSGPKAPLGDLERLSPSGRVWLLFSTDSRTHDGRPDQTELVEALGKQRTLLDERRARGAWLYLFDRRRTL